MALVFQARGTYEPGHSSPVDHGPRLDLGSRCPMGRRATRLTPRGEPALCQARRHRGRWGRRRTDRTDTAPPEVARGGVNPSYARAVVDDGGEGLQAEGIEIHACL